MLLTKVYTLKMNLKRVKITAEIAEFNSAKR